MLTGDVLSAGGILPDPKAARRRPARLTFENFSNELNCLVLNLL
jgi:hypothetical protein